MASAANPAGKVLFSSLARGKTKEHCHTVGIARDEIMPVERKKKLSHNISRPLVAVDEGMIARNSECVGRRERRRIRLAIERQVHRPAKRRLKRAPIANSRGAAMLGKLFVMDRENDTAVDEDPSHLASSRNTARRRFMIFRASVI